MPNTFVFLCFSCKVFFIPRSISTAVSCAYIAFDIDTELTPIKSGTSPIFDNPSFLSTSDNVNTLLFNAALTIVKTTEITNVKIITIITNNGLFGLIGFTGNTAGSYKTTSASSYLAEIFCS